MGRLSPRRDARPLLRPSPALGRRRPPPRFNHQARQDPRPAGAALHLVLPHVERSILAGESRPIVPPPPPHPNTPSNNERRGEMERRERWATYYSGNSAALAHYHLALSGAGVAIEPYPRPASPPMPPQMMAAAADVVSAAAPAAASAAAVASPAAMAATAASVAGGGGGWGGHRRQRRRQKSHEH